MADRLQRGTPAFVAKLSHPKGVHRNPDFPTNPTIAGGLRNGLKPEGDHAQEANLNPTTYINGVRSGNSLYGNLEEKRVVRGSEASFARSLGEPERFDHLDRGHCKVTTVLSRC